MIIIPGKIPIMIHPFFWILASVIGILYGGFSLFALIWIAIVFISVLFHEFGHALTALLFKQHPQISLVALGGLTSYEGKGLNFIKQFLIVLNGPVFGFALCYVCYQIIALSLFENIYLVYFFSGMWKINLFWSVVNLLPIVPLDGGQLMRIVFEAIFGQKGFRVALVLSMLIAFVLAIASFLFLKGFWIAGMIFFLFAFQNFQLFQQAKKLTSNDSNEEVKDEILQAEKALLQGQKEEAKRHFYNIRDKNSSGLIFTTATQYLGMLEYEEGNKKEAYKLLMQVHKELTAEARLILHQLAFEFQDYEQVASSSQKCYQIKPTQKTAMLNSKAFAFLNRPKEAGGWLRTAMEYGAIDIEKTLNQPPFLEIKEDPEFKKFFQ